MAGRERARERESERERGKKEGKKKKKERKERKKEISSARGSVGPGTGAHPAGRLRAGRGDRGSRRRRSGRRRRKGWAGAARPGGNQWAGCARPRFVALSRRTKAAGSGAGLRTVEERKKREGEEKEEENQRRPFPSGFCLPSLLSRPPSLPKPWPNASDAPPSI